MTREEILAIAKPILFNTDMVRAILDGRKSVTRRAVKLKYDNTHHEMFTNKYGTRLIEIENEVPGVTFGKREDGTSWHRIRGYIEPKAPYKKGNILYVRETWGCYSKNWGDAAFFLYKADYPDGATTYEYDGHICDIPKWRPSIHMPKEIARIFLRVTDVRVERLWDIDSTGILAEGVSNGKSNPAMGKRWENMQRMAFSELWDSTIHKKDMAKYGWATNPWVWVIEFEKVEVSN